MRNFESHRKSCFSDFFFAILDGNADDEEDEDQSNSDWLYDLQEPEGKEANTNANANANPCMYSSFNFLIVCSSGLCNPNPCLNGGECKQKGRRKFKCDCPKPFKGRRCERGPELQDEFIE